MGKETNYVYIHPKDKELMETVINAACNYFEIDESIMLNNSSTDIANIRYIVCYIIMKNTELKDYIIAKRVNKARSTINTGVEKIDIHKDIYRQTLDNINGVISVANNFEKKYVWHLRLQG